MRRAIVHRSNSANMGRTRIVPMVEAKDAAHTLFGEVVVAVITIVSIGAARMEQHGNNNSE